MKESQATGSVMRIFFAAALTFWRDVQSKTWRNLLTLWWSDQSAPRMWSREFLPATALLRLFFSQKWVIRPLCKCMPREAWKWPQLISICAPYSRTQSIPILAKVGLLKFLLAVMVNFLLILMACGSSTEATRIQTSSNAMLHFYSEFDCMRVNTSQQGGLQVVQD